MQRQRDREPARPGQSEMMQWLVDRTPSLLHVCDAYGRIVLANRAWSERVGLAEADFVGRDALEFVHPDEAAVLRADIVSLPCEGFVEREARVRDADGEWTWFTVSIRRLAEQLVVFMRDASAAHARAAEFEEDRRARALLSAAAGIGSWTYEPAENRLTWSEELMAHLGLAGETRLTTETLQAVAHPSDLRRLLHLFRRGMTDAASGKAQLRVREGAGWRTLSVHFRCRRRSDGVLVVLGTTQDVTELVQARDSARDRERRMRQARREAQTNARRLKLALEVARAGVYEVDHVGRTFWASPEFEQLTGKVGSSYDDATQLRYPGFHPDDLPHVRASLLAMRSPAAARGGAFEARIVREDGEARWARVFHRLKLDRHGEPQKAIGLIQDIDVYKRQELALQDAQRAAEAATEAKSAFLANISHEIRTPMNGIMGVLHLLKSESLTEEGRALLEEALSCGAMLAELLNDVIDFSKIEADKLELNPEPVEIPALVRGVAALLRPLAENKSLALEVEIDPALGWVRTDPVRLRQALFNLAGNAVKFTERGRVAVRCAGAGEGRLRFEIEDTGVGIPLEAQPRIFERFDQGDASTTRRFGGSGLGLAITKRLAELMGGDVGFSSTPGEGSTFWLEIAAAPARAADTARTDAGQPLQGLSVLVVEDNATNRLIATKLLEQLGATVQTAADGHLGIEAVRDCPFDLILMDVQMPGIDGLEAARRIRALGGVCAAIPIIALTANVLAHQRQTYLAAGMDGVVGKPISPTELLGELARLAGPAQEPGEGPRAAAS